MNLSKLAAFAAAFCAIGNAASAEAVQLKARFAVLPLTRSVPLPTSQRANTITPLRNWSYLMKDPVNGATYKGTILGQSIYAATKGTTSLSLQIVPLAMTLNDGTRTRTYDPTAPDSCYNGLSTAAYVAGSPLFSTSTVWKMNGVSVGQTQYIDAFQRAEFWSFVRGSNYHLLLDKSQLATQKLKFGPTNTLNESKAEIGSSCAGMGITDIGGVEPVIQGLITGALSASINSGTFPVFLLHNVVMSAGYTNNCCILGYHSAMLVGGRLQVYAVADVDSTGTFSGSFDVTALSHELGETINDPTGGNPTNAWGYIGQVSGCQGNFEVGDPLTGTEMPAITSGGNTYHVQELAFFSWFYQQAKSIGAGGKYSDNGTFTTRAETCG